MPGRHYDNGSQYRYGFNGQEKDNEIYGDGGSYTAEFWQYDPRLGRRWNIDPIYRAYESQYAVFGNNPILLHDPDGQSGDDPQKHTVQANDNLTKIASQFGVSVSSLVKWNKIKKPNHIVVGQVLIVSDPSRPLDRKNFEAYPNFGPSTGWTLRNLNHKNEFEITSVTNGAGLGVASMSNYDVVYLKGQLLDKIKADDDMVVKQNEIIASAKSDPRYGKEKFYLTGYKSVGFGGDRWRSTNEDWFSTSRDKNPLLHTSTIKVGLKEVTWALRNATVKYWVEVDPRGSINIEYRLYDRLDLSGSNKRSDDYNNISNFLGFFYHGVAGGNSNLQTRAEWSVKK